MTKKNRRRLEAIVAISMVTVAVIALAVVNTGMHESARWDGYLPGLQALSFLILYLVAHFTVGSIVRRKGKRVERA